MSGEFPNLAFMLPTAETVFDTGLSDDPDDKVVSPELAEGLYHYFKDSTLFRWTDRNNDCEDRANAICILLETWGIPNYKGWVFSGFFIKKNSGSLINSWNYHVAAAIPIQQGQTIAFYIIDPSTSSRLVTIENWALQITSSDKSYHCIRDGKFYIFQGGKIKKDNWYRRNKRNYNWTIQGLAGINGLSSKGKAKLAFNKEMVKRTAKIFEKLKNESPF